MEKVAVLEYSVPSQINTAIQQLVYVLDILALRTHRLARRSCTNK